MKVYVVLGGWEYEGCDECSAKVFTDRNAANAYGASIWKETCDDSVVFSYDFYRVVEREVE